MLDYSKSYELIMTIFWNGGAWPREQLIGFWWRSVPQYGSFKDCLFTIAILIDN